MKHTNLMIAPIFIRSETLSSKRNSKKTASVIFGKNVACNYCIEKTSRVILKKKTASVMVKKRRVFTVMALLGHRTIKLYLPRFIFLRRSIM
jgi:hypothetical protein